MNVDDQLKLLEEESIRNSLYNLFSFPNIKSKIQENKLTIHGLIHDIESGELKYLDPTTNKFKKV